MNDLNFTIKVDEEIFEFTINKYNLEREVGFEIKRRSGGIFLYRWEIENEKSYIKKGPSFDHTMCEINGYLLLYKEALEKYKRLLVLL